MLKKLLLFTMLFSLITISDIQIQAAAAPFNPQSINDLIFENPALNPGPTEDISRDFSNLVYQRFINRKRDGINRSDIEKADWIISNWDAYINMRRLEDRSRNQH